MHNNSMANFKSYEIILHLQDIRHLFQAPELDPLAGQVNPVSGLEQIISELKPKSLGRQVRTTIWLPQDHLFENIEQFSRDALRRYCEARIHLITNDLASLRWQGIKALQTGLIFLAACLLLSTFFDGLDVLPEFLRRFLGEGFLIVGWVSLWHPTELLLYEWWPHWRDKQLHERIKDMELKIEAEE